MRRRRRSTKSMKKKKRERRKEDKKKLMIRSTSCGEMERKIILIKCVWQFNRRKQHIH